MPLLTYLAFSYGYQKHIFYNIWVAITLSIEYNSYYSYCILLAISVYCVLIQRPSTYHSCDTQHPCTVVYDIFDYCYTWSCVVCWVFLLERAFSSVLLNVRGIAYRAVYAVHSVYYGHIETIHMCTDYQGVHDYPGQLANTC